MAWQNPKKNWVAGDIPGAGDFNRIEGNAEYLKGQTDGLKSGSIKAGNAVKLGGQSPSYYAKQADIDELQNEVVKRAQIITGQYTGNGSSSREISLGFTPKAVIVSDYYNRVWIAVTGHGLSGVSIITNGFRVTYYASQNLFSNVAGSRYNYIAFM